MAQSPLDSGTAVEGDKHKNGKDVSFLGSIPKEYAAKGPMDMMDTQNTVGRGPKSTRDKDDSGAA